jgi:hypothetical protein
MFVSNPSAGERRGIKRKSTALSRRGLGPLLYMILIMRDDNERELKKERN